MVEQVVKIIPSKGTRLNLVIILEFLAIVWAFYMMFNAPDVSDLVTFSDWADFQIEIFAAWSSFTVWNVGTYAASETVVKGAEGVMNRGDG